MNSSRAFIRIATGLAVISAAGSSLVQAGSSAAMIIPALHQDVSRPLAEMALPDGPVADQIGSTQAWIPDQPAGKNPAMTTVLNINAMTYTPAFQDVDPNGAVGQTQYVQWTNARYAVFSKATKLVILNPTQANTLWKGFGGACETSNLGDGIVNYDKAAGRWIITHHSGNTAPFLQCIAVSTSDDATGTYYRYAFQLTTLYPDWPKLGVWPDAYYLTMNVLAISNFANMGSEVCALNRSNMLTGGTATAQCFTAGTSTSDYVLQPSDLDGLTPPPAGSPNYLLSLSTNALDFYKFHVDWVTPANSTLTGPSQIAVQPFTQICLNTYCIPQLNSTQMLDGVGDRLMWRLAYRNFGAYESLAVTHTVVAGAGAGLRWYEIRSPGTTPVVFQQGTYAPDSASRFMGSIAMDKLGNLAVGYSESSAASYPSILFTGRLVTDPLGTLENESLVWAGTGSQQPADFHWGDYTSLTVDPVDDCTMWYTNEYYKTSGVGTWSTRICAFKFTSCQ